MAQFESKCPFCERPQIIRNIDNCLSGRWYGHTCSVCGCRYKVFIEAVLTIKNQAIFKEGGFTDLDDLVKELAEING